jgi:hypothetical protein
MAEVSIAFSPLVSTRIVEVQMRNNLIQVSEMAASTGYYNTPIAAREGSETDNTGS